ncbi:MAG: proton extrusion protein PcxA [Leptolyngbyaceae cyanobacterium bins.59]|nr:proton extrusion protein PcxA [Leptolyngbyaceae cyanobacterium bins.59]
MPRSSFTRVTGFLRAYGQWLSGTADRALDQAYDAALSIKAIEDEHFNGQKISVSANLYTANVQARFEVRLKRCLTTTYVRLAEFKTSSLFLEVTGSTSANGRPGGYGVQGDRPTRTEREQVILEKLAFIDEILTRYGTSPPRPQEPPSTALTVVPRSPQTPVLPDSSSGRSSRGSADPMLTKRTSDAETITDKTGVLPRSILSTFNRIKKELDPKAEDEVVRDFRNSRSKTIISLRFVLFLVLIPLLSQQIAKNFIVGPIVDRVRSQTQAPVFLNLELEESALRELQVFEEHLRFENMLRKAPPLSTEEMEDQVREKATELAVEYNDRSSNAIKNIFSDLFAVGAFVIVLLTRRLDLEIFKSFIDEVVYGLSDSAKAFIIILFTDVFVGFHSPHGWEVILESFSRHLGLPENREFIFLFIATFPVILDTIFKYWIFRYLNRISPSAVATYRNMNE